MLKIADASINSLPYPATSIADSQFLTVVLAELQELCEEVAQLREESQNLREQINQLKIENENLSENQFIQLKLINDLRKDPEPNERTRSHVDELHRLMVDEKIAQISILKASRLLGISKERMRQLKPLILADGRFEMGWTNLKGQKGVVIKIRQYIK